MKQCSRFIPCPTPKGSLMKLLMVLKVEPRFILCKNSIIASLLMFQLYLAFNKIQFFIGWRVLITWWQVTGETIDSLEKKKWIEEERCNFYIYFETTCNGAIFYLCAQDSLLMGLRLSYVLLWIELNRSLQYASKWLNPDITYSSQSRPFYDFILAHSRGRDGTCHQIQGNGDH